MTKNSNMAIKLSKTNLLHYMMLSWWIFAWKFHPWWINQIKILRKLNFEENYPENFKAINSINQRKNRLTQNNLIFSTNISFTRDTKKDVSDENFSLFKFKFELAGNLLSSIAKTII
jgi:hypothetical protein